MSTKKFPEPQAYSERQRPPIQLNPVESNQVGAIGYDPETKTLAVRFRRGAGAIYHYPGVERETFEAFRGADSIGTYFGQNIKALPFEKFPPEGEATEAAA